MLLLNWEKHYIFWWYQKSICFVLNVLNDIQYRPAPTLKVRGLCDDSIIDRHYVLELDQDGTPVLIGKVYYFKTIAQFS